MDGIKGKRALAAAMTAVLMITLAGCQNANKNQKKSEYLETGTLTGSGYRTAEVYLGDFEVTYDGDARVECLKQQSLFWESANDRYGELLVQQGQRVKKGDVLATFEVSVSEADLMERTLAIQEVESSMAQTSQRYEEQIAKKLESMKKLESYAYQIAALELEKLRSEYSQQMAEGQYQLNQLHKALQELTEKKETNQLLAPFDGIIARVSGDFQKGDRVEMREPIVVLEDESSQMIRYMNINTQLPVPYLSKVNLVDRRTKEELTGTVVSCPSVTSGGRGDVIVQADRPLTEEEIQSFMAVNGTVMKKVNVVLVSTEALKEEGNKLYVNVLGDNNSVQKHYVSVGARERGTAWITEGLEAGQKVILD